MGPGVGKRQYKKPKKSNPRAQKHKNSRKERQAPLVEYVDPAELLGNVH